MSFGKTPSGLICLTGNRKHTGRIMAKYFPHRMRSINSHPRSSRNPQHEKYEKKKKKRQQSASKSNCSKPAIKANS